MFTMTLDEWAKYRDLLKKLSDKASDEFRDAVFSVNGRWHGVGLGNIPREELLEFATALVTKYGEGASALACEMYDAIATISGVYVPPAEPAEIAKIGEVAKTIYGAAKTGNEDLVSNAVGRLVKRAGQDTTLKNAIRDGAQFAWIPSGDTCAFCLALASRGWQTATAKALRNGHAEHIHSNCDCAYATNFNNSVNYAAYDPDKYYDMWKNAEGDNAEEKLNSMRRDFYQQNKERINAQKRSAYEKRKELNAPSAEEFNTDN